MAHREFVQRSDRLVRFQENASVVEFVVGGFLALVVLGLAVLLVPVVGLVWLMVWAIRKHRGRNSRKPGQGKPSQSPPPWRGYETSIFDLLDGE